MKKMRVCAAMLMALALGSAAGCAPMAAHQTQQEALADNVALLTGEVEVNAEDLDASENLATYVTEFAGGSKGRIHNIQLAAEKVNGTTVEPGTVFSFNDTVGPTGKSSGFKKARIFVNGKDAEGYGGGVCQVSSTIYNAALAAGLEIVERHPHSKPVAYVPENKDAATSYGGKDFRFKNSTKAPVVVRASANEGLLTVKIVGK